MGEQKIVGLYDDKLQSFIDFVLSQYVKEGVHELASGKLPDLLELKYSGISDATEYLGSVAGIPDS